jgi:hemolysin III
VSTKPLLRGVMHQLGFVASVPLGALLIVEADAGQPRVAAIVFASCVSAMFGASALYHRPTWSVGARRRLRRLDHAGIFLLIAGTYTPFALLVLTGAWRITVLAIVWVGATGSIALRLAWSDAPKWLAPALGIPLGWVGALVFPQFVHRLGVWPSLVTLAGGVCYTIGALVYMRRRPDPLPTVFGYHEIFHVFVTVAVALQYVVVAFAILPRS